MNKKAQEEIAGFVVVVVLLSIIFVIILGFSLNKKNVQDNQDVEIRHFLESLRQVTTDCSLTGPIPVNFKELSGACYESLTCSSGISACDSLESSIKEILSSGFTVGPEARFKSYNFSISYELSSESKDQILSIDEGNCSGSFKESYDLFPYSNGQIFTSLRLCF